MTSYNLTTFTLSNCFNIFISLFTVLLFWGSIKISFEYIFIAYLFLLFLLIANLTVAYEPLPSSFVIK